MNETEQDDRILPQRRKLRVLILSMGGERRRILEDLFASVESSQFEPPTFCPGVPSRELRTRALLWQHLKAAGILPPAEWDFVEQYDHSLNHADADAANANVPIDPLRRGNDQDVAVPYAVEFWRKAKTINRGRAVLACALAHLRALRQLTQEHFDVLIEDNVRFSVQEVAQRIWDCIDATTTPNADGNETPCHMRYYGWLGSQPNVHWIYTTFIPRCNEQRSHPVVMVPCPIPSDIVDPATKVSSQTKDLSQPGGSNPVWGAYAYWISPEAYHVLIETLQRDVGALLWKSKRMRYYQVKPIDKVIPRILRSHFNHDPACIQIPVRPAFFRAPMLTSQIHTQWDAAFCRSTTDQLRLSGSALQWTDLGLTETEQQVVARAQSTGWTEWCTPAQLSLASSDAILATEGDNNISDAISRIAIQ